MIGSSLVSLSLTDVIWGRGNGGRKKRRKGIKIRECQVGVWMCLCAYCIDINIGAFIYILQCKIEAQRVN